METTTEYQIQREYDGSFGLGEVIVPRVRLFRKGDYGLTKTQLEARVKERCQPKQQQQKPQQHRGKKQFKKGRNN